MVLDDETYPPTIDDDQGTLEQGLTLLTVRGLRGPLP